MRFQNHIAVVTGAAKGIGAAAAALYAREGAHVALLDVDPAGAETAAALGDRARFFTCDVSNGEAVAATFAAVREAFGGVSILVNNAGIQRYGTATTTTEAAWDEVMNANLKSAFLCAHAALPLMLERERGVVVNVASVQAFISQANVAAYTTSKTALLGLTRSIAVDFAPRVRCVAVCPGSVDTPMLRWSVEQSPNPDEVWAEIYGMHPAQRIATPDEVAAFIGFLSSDDAGFVTGQAYRIDGGLGLSIPGSQRD
jgi:NAD(P)-dependent dehydrogenase (short-subunit alcohol dehydrogenase family)